VSPYPSKLVAAVSKYFSETEKNLDQVFAAAETVAVVLLLDEADALFGRGAAVPDARHRYPNDRGRSILLTGIVVAGVLGLCLSLRHRRPRCKR
jgi:hypothetical protein